MLKLAMPLTAILGSFGLASATVASSAPVPSSATGDVSVSSTKAKVTSRKVTLSVTCAETPDTDQGCSGGRVVVLRGGIRSTGGTFGELANGATVKVSIKIDAKLARTVEKVGRLKVKTQTLTAASGEAAGLIRPLTLLA